MLGDLGAFHLRWVTHGRTTRQHACTAGTVPPRASSASMGGYSTHRRSQKCAGYPALLEYPSLAG